MNTSASIHMHIEVKMDGQWVHYSAPSPFKDMGLSDLLGGPDWVFSPVVMPKGLPDDMSGLTKYCYEMDNENNLAVHHEGWLSSDELHRLQRRLRELNPGKDPWQTDLEKMYFHCHIGGNAVSSHDGFEDSRLVFWFC